MRVVIADDVMLIRSGIARLLGDTGIEVVGEAADAGELLRLVALGRPDAAIVDIRMPPTHTDEGLVAARQIRERYPDTAVVVLSQYVESRYAERLLADQPGGVGYLLKERVSDIAVLVDALRRVADGECVLDPTIVSRLMRRRRPGLTPDPAHQPGARHSGADGGRPLQLGHRRRTPHQRAHRRGHLRASVPQAPTRAVRADVNRRVLAVLTALRG